MHIETKSVPITPKAHNTNNEIQTSGGIFFLFFTTVTAIIARTNAPKTSSISFGITSLGMKDSNFATSHRFYSNVVHPVRRQSSQLSIFPLGAAQQFSPRCPRSDCLSPARWHGPLRSGQPQRCDPPGTRFRRLPLRGSGLHHSGTI